MIRATYRLHPRSCSRPPTSRSPHPTTALTAASPARKVASTTDWMERVREGSRGRGYIEEPRVLDRRRSRVHHSLLSFDCGIAFAALEGSGMATRGGGSGREFCVS